MKRRLSYVFFGAAAGLAARLLLPPHKTTDLLVVAALAAVGGFLAGWAGEQVQLFPPGRLPAVLIAVLGAFVCLTLYGALVR
ncbi:MAG: hypothetical protein ABI995_09065 [Acidobacteriota bacterium]